MPIPNVHIRPTTIALWNDFDLWIDGAAVRGVKSDVLSFRGYIAAERDDELPIHPALDVPLNAEGGGTGDYLNTIPGTAVGDHLSALLWEPVYVVLESVPRGAFREAFAVTVVNDQGG